MGAAKVLTDDASPARAEAASVGVATPGQDKARRSITRRTVTPPGGDTTESRWRLFGDQRSHGLDLHPAREPYPGPNVLRVVMTTMLAVLCLLTIGGAVLILLLWQQDRDTGVLTTQIDRTWQIFGYLRDVEHWVALLVIPVAVAWIGLATLNVGRATGQTRNVFAAAASLPVGIAGVLYIGSEVVAKADSAPSKGAGIALQAVFVAIPLLALERVAEAADARHRPLRVTFLAAVGFLAQLQGLGGLSTVEPTNDPARWGRLGAYLVINALVLVLGALAANEAARAIEEATDHRYQLRHRFGEALLGQAGLR